MISFKSQLDPVQCQLTEKILKSKFQSGFTIEVVLKINQHFNIVVACMYCLYLQINITLVQ